MLGAGGGGGGGSTAMYVVQIESLEDFQKKLNVILQDLEGKNAGMTVGFAVGSMAGAGDGASTFVDFPEAQLLGAAYEQSKQHIIQTFNEVTQLVNTMI